MSNQHAAVEVNDRLELKLTAIGASPMRQLTVGLTRIMARHLAEALLEYSGARAKGFGRDRRTIVPGQDLTPRPALPQNRGPVRITPRKKHVVVRL